MEERSTELSADTSLSAPSKSQVGYGRPPSHSQFKPGRSGNPNGRPKGSKSIAFFLKKHLFSMVTVRENGRQRQMTKLDVGLTKMANRCEIAQNSDPAQDRLNVLISLRKWLQVDESRKATIVTPQNVGKCN